VILFGPEPVVKPGTTLHAMVAGRRDGVISMDLLSRPGGYWPTACGQWIPHGISLPDDPATVPHEQVCRDCLRALGRDGPDDHAAPVRGER